LGVKQVEVVRKRQEKNKSDCTRLLQRVIQQRHRCEAIHRESVHVHEVLDGQTIWEGNVEVFDLKDHSEAERCYGWSHREEGTSGHVLNSENMRLITVLGKRPVDSPEMAVRTAIFFDVQPVLSPAK
jgi:hypothetical protein